MSKDGILVTGGSGLVGAYTVRMLLEKGERPVVFDVAVNERLLGAIGVDLKSISVVRGDILDLPGLITAIRDHGIGRIIHFAAFLGEEVQRRPYSGVRLNLMGTVLACLKDKLKDNIFHIGSGEMATGEQIVAALTRHFPKAKITLLKGERPMPYPEERIPNDQSRAREQLGYQPDYLLEKALGDYAETLRKIESI